MLTTVNGYLPMEKLRLREVRQCAQSQSEIWIGIQARLAPASIHHIAQEIGGTLFNFSTPQRQLVVIIPISEVIAGSNGVRHLRKILGCTESWLGSWGSVAKSTTTSPPRRPSRHCDPASRNTRKLGGRAHP